MIKDSSFSNGITSVIRQVTGGEGSFTYRRIFGCYDTVKSKSIGMVYCVSTSIILITIG